MTKKPTQGKSDLFHKLRNYLSPIATFLQVVPCDAPPKLKNYHKLCQENLLKIEELIRRLEKV